MCKSIRLTTYNTPRRYRKYVPNKDIRNSLYLAFSKSFSSDVQTGKHCAVLLDENNTIVKTFVNCHKKDGFGTVHAEEGLIKHIIIDYPDFDFSKCKIVIVRGNKIGRFSNSAPCDKCLKLMLSVNVGQIIFTSRDNVVRIISR